MLLPYISLTFYGPATAALVGADAQGVMQDATPHQSMRGGISAVGTGDAPLLRPYRGRNAALNALGEGLLQNSGARKATRAALEVLVSALSQDDVTGAVLEAPIEAGLTMRQVLRLLLAYAAGDATGLDSSPAFKSQDGTATRIAGTVVAGTRTITTIDGG